MKEKRTKTGAFCLLLFLAVVTGCKDKNLSEENLPFDPTKQIEITDFEPKEATARTQLLIYGKNFGDDPQKVRLRIGGVDSKAIGCNDTCIYCMVPRNAKTGVVEVSIGEQTVLAKERFEYVANSQVSTLCGYVDETGRYEVADGSFDKCGLATPMWLTTDPKNPKHVYMIEAGNSIRMLDMEKKEISTIITVGRMNITTPRTLQWSVTADTLYVQSYETNDNPIVMSMLLRSEEFKKAHVLFSGYKFVISAAVHPKTGDIYFNTESDASIKRYSISTGEVQTMFSVGGTWIWLYTYFHPSGEYAYIVRPRDGAIKKSFYNESSKTLEYPTDFVGAGWWGYQEGIGTNVRMGVLWQGVFVKNQEYEDQGKEDIYDFYMTDGELWGTHPCDLIWRVTPFAEAPRYAGQGSKAMDNNWFGYVDGDLLQEARFYGPQGFAYDEEGKVFYIGESLNHRIRQIIVE